MAVRLQDYYTGELPLVDRLHMEDHLATCADCRRSLTLMMTLGDGPVKSYGTGHITPELMTRYFQKRGELPATEAESIQQHLQSCESCQHELEFLTGMESELQAAAALSIPLKPRSGLGSFWYLITRPAVAWALVLLTAYPTVNWVVDRFISATTKGGLDISGPVYQLKETRRGAEERFQVLRRADDRVLDLVIPMYTLPGEMEYEFEFVQLETRKSVQPQVISDFRTRGEIRLLVSVQDLNDGPYELAVSERSIGSQDVHSQKSFSFQLVTEH